MAQRGGCCAQLVVHLLRGVEALEGVPDKQREQLRFAARGLVDAMSPSNFALTNPEVVAKTIETKGQNLLDGMKHMLADIGKARGIAPFNTPAPAPHIDDVMAGFDVGARPVSGDVGTKWDNAWREYRGGREFF